MPSIYQKKKVQYQVSFLGHITGGALTDTRSETEYVDSGMEGDTEKKPLQIIA